MILHSTSVTVAHNEFINNNASTSQLREVVGTINSTSVIVAHNEFVNNNDETMKGSLCRQLDHKKLVLGVVVNILNSTSVIVAHNEFVNSIALYVVHSYQTTTLQESRNEFMENNVVYDVFISPRCRSGYDYSLGSSHCVKCPDHWRRNLIGIAIAAIVAGFVTVLVAFILALNMTIAVGTLNGILFYANIVFANADTYLPYSTPNFASVLILWLNLDIGFNVCFFEGMDNTDKPLIQLAFPAYVTFLVVMVFIISECSSNFARLIGRGNPVAALATMILLSYAKLFNVIIAGSVIMLYGNPSYGSRNLDVRKLNQDGLATILYRREAHCFDCFWCSYSPIRHSLYCSCLLLAVAPSLSRNSHLQVGEVSETATLHGVSQCPLHPKVSLLDWHAIACTYSSVFTFSLKFL